MLWAVPEDSSLYEYSQSLMSDWQREWADNRSNVRAARLAIERDELTQATQLAQEISYHSAWVFQREELLLEIQRKGYFFDCLAQEAEQYLWENRLQLAAETAYKLPDVTPWRQRKLEILEKVRITKTSLSWLPVAFSVAATLLLRVLVKAIFGRK